MIVKSHQPRISRPINTTISESPNIIYHLSMFHCFKTIQNHSKPSICLILFVKSHFFLGLYTPSVLCSTNPDQESSSLAVRKLLGRLKKETQIATCRVINSYATGHPIYWRYKTYHTTFTHIHIYMYVYIYIHNHPYIKSMYYVRAM